MEQVVIIPNEDELAQQANATIASAVGCTVRADGRKCHVFLDHSNKCQCGDVDLLAYRREVLK